MLFILQPGIAATATMKPRFQNFDIRDESAARPGAHGLAAGDPLYGNLRAAAAIALGKASIGASPPRKPVRQYKFAKTVCASA